MRHFQNRVVCVYQWYTKETVQQTHGEAPTRTQSCCHGLKFEPDKHVLPSQYPFESILKKTVRNPCFFAFDFEAICKKHFAKNQCIISKHKPVAYVLKYVDYHGSSDDYSTEYVGPNAHEAFVDYVVAIHDDLKAHVTKLFWKTYGNEINALKETQCTCTPMYRHRAECPKKSGTIERAQRCGFKQCCSIRESHSQWYNEVVEDMHQVRYQFAKQTKQDVSVGIINIVKAYLPKPKRCKWVSTVDSLRKQYIKVPLYGFNSPNYDMTFVVKAMGKSKTVSLSNVISKASGFMSLGFGIYRFLDVWLLGNPNLSLEKAGKQWGVKTTKGHFPYAWFDSIDKLQHKNLPSREHWFNALITKKCRREITRLLSLNTRRKA